MPGFFSLGATARVKDLPAVGPRSVTLGDVSDSQPISLELLLVLLLLLVLRKMQRLFEFTGGNRRVAA